MSKFISKLFVISFTLGLLVGCKSESKKIMVTGSTTVLPIAQKAAEVYMKTKNQKADITISGGGSGVGITALIDKRTDIANSSRMIKDEEIVTAKSKGINPVGTMIAKDALAIIVSKDVNIKDIKLDSLKAIYNGTIKNWKDLGGPNKPITIVSRDTSSGTYETFENKVMHKDKVSNEALMVASNKAVATTVAQTPYSIGYIGLGYITNDFNVLTVEGVMPSDDTVNSGSYKISRGLYMYTDGTPKGEVADFINFILSPEGQKIAIEQGFVALKK